MTRSEEANVVNGTVHQRIRADIEKNILSNRWPPGFRIPVERELTDQYGCARMTVSKVLSGLAASGMIERRRKAGSFVAKPPIQSAVLQIPDMKAAVEARQQVYGYTLLSSKTRAANKSDLALLERSAASAVLSVRCRHDAGRRPFALEERLISLDVVPEAEAEDFSLTPPSVWLVSKVPWSEAEHHIYARSADRQTAMALGIDPDTACLVVERRTWRGRDIVTFVRLTFPGDMYHLIARFSPGESGRSPGRAPSKQAAAGRTKD